MPQNASFAGKPNVIARLPIQPTRPPPPLIQLDARALDDIRKLGNVRRDHLGEVVDWADETWGGS